METYTHQAMRIRVKYFLFYNSYPVSDGKGLGQPACQEEWKKCKREEE
jgi:hypothetical protein